MRVLYLGSPEFAVPPLDLLLQAGHQVVGVVTPAGRPGGRGRKLLDPPLAEAARARSLPLFQPEKACAPELRELLAPLAVEVAVTAAFGQYLTQAFLALPCHGVVNIHPSLLPRWRGASPVMSALLAGDRVTGVTLLRSTRVMDAGPILAQEPSEIGPDESAGELTERLFRRGGQLLVELLPRLARGDVREREQDPALATTCTKVGREEAEIIWTRPADEIARRVRAFDSAPVAWTSLGGRTLRIWRAKAAPGGSQGAETVSVLPVRPEGAATLPAGTLLGPPSAPAPLVVCGEGYLLLEQVQLEGSRRMSAVDAWRGLRLPDGRAHLGETS